MNKNNTTIKVCNILAAVLAAALLVLQFLPFWYATPLNSVHKEYHTAAELAELPAEKQEEATPVSLAKACWFPEEKEPVPVFIGGFMCLALVMIFFCLKNMSSSINFVWPMGSGIIALLGYLNGNAGTIAANGRTVLVPVLTPEFLQAGNLWIVHVALCGALILVSVVLAFFSLQNVFAWLFGSPNRKKAA